MAEQLSPGIQFTEPRNTSAVISSVSTSVGAMVGIARRGPINRATLTGNIDEFQRFFGGLISGSYLYRSAKAFFENGGTSLYIVRVGHYTDITNPATLDAVKASKQLQSNGSNSCVVEASSEGVHGNEIGVTIARQNTQIATNTSGTGTSPITSLAISDVRQVYVGAQLSLVGAVAVAGSVTSSAGPFKIKPNDHWDISINEGASQIWTFGGTRGSVTGAAATYAAVGGGGTIVLRVNEDNTTDTTITFTGSENTELKYLAAINDQWNNGAGTTYGVAIDSSAQVKLESSRYGTSSNIRVVSGTAGILTSLGLSVGLGTAGTATLTKTGGTGTKTVTIGFLDAALASEIATAVGTADGVTGGMLTAVGSTLVLATTTTGAAPNGVQVKNTSTNSLGFDNLEHNGQGSATIRFIVTRLDSGTNTVYFSSLTPGANIPSSSPVYLEEVDFLVYRSGNFLERIAKLAMSSLAPNYFMTVINNNDPARQIDILTDNALVAAAAVDPRPDNQSNTLLLNGSDGTTPNDTDHIGDPTTDATHTGRGLYALDVVHDQINILAVPGRTSAAVHKAVITYVEQSVYQDMFAILDPPSGQTPSQIQTYVAATANLYSEYAAIYYPWVKANDPITGILTTYPPSGDIMGVYARTDAQRGVQKAPAGTPDGQIANVLGVERTLTSADRDLLYPSNVNPVLAKTGEGILVFGSRTLANSTFRQINVRRVFNFVKRSLNSGLQWVVFEPSDATTRGRVRAAVNVFLLRQWRNGLLKGTKATDAFYVVCDETNNPPSVELAGQLVCKIGLAIARPAEFVTFQLVQDTRAVDAELAQAGL